MYAIMCMVENKSKDSIPLKILMFVHYTKCQRKLVVEPLIGLGNVMVNIMVNIMVNVMDNTMVNVIVNVW